MNTKVQESNKKKIALLIRSAQWTVADRTENQISAVCLKNNQDDITMQMNQKIVQQNQKIDSQNKLINQQSQMMNQQNKKIDNLNNLLHLQEDINAELRNRIEILERIGQNGNTVSRKSKLNNVIESTPSRSRTAILMADSNPDPHATVFGSKIKRSEISAIYVKNTLEDVPATAWDVSAAKDRSVMAWTCTASDIVSRILYLAANGDIYANPDCSYLFANYTKLTAADFSYLKTDLVTNMYGMFSNCNNLKQLDVSRWDVSNITNMCSMFRFCIQLQALDVSHWNVSNVIHMNSMFAHCEQLQILDVSRWDVSNVTNMESMFESCKQLQTLDVSHWDVSSVTNMMFMFGYCKQLQALDISHWNVSNVTTMVAMFCACEQLQILDVSHWDVSNVTNMDRMFCNCPYINRLGKGALSSWKLNPNVTMHNFCKGTKFENNPLALFRK